MIGTERHLATAALIAAMATTGSQAALIGSTLDTFSNDGTSGVVPTAYLAEGTMQRNETTSAAFTSNQSLVNPEADGTNLDEENDGYLLITRNDASTSGFIRDLGVIEAGDVGKVINIDFDVLKPGASGVNSFYVIQLMNPDTTLESAVSEIQVAFGDEGLFSILANGGNPLSYTVAASDVGKTAQFAGRAFVSGNGQRQLGLDAVSIEIVPEPASLALLGLGGLLISRRRKAASN